MSKYQLGLTPELMQMLEHNGIDYKRCIDFKIEHTAKDGPIYITVTMIALTQEKS